MQAEYVSNKMQALLLLVYVVSAIKNDIYKSLADMCGIIIIFAFPL